MHTHTAFATGIYDGESGLGSLLGLAPLLEPRAPTAAAEETTADGEAARVEDARCLKRVQAGDEDAARALFQRLYPTVIKSVRCHRARLTSEEDLVQAVFAKIFKKLHQFSGLVPLEHWVSRITVNTCISQLAREKVRPELRMSDLSEDELGLVDYLMSTGQEVQAEGISDASEVLEKLLSRLKPDERLVVRLLHLEEKTTAEISALTGWSVSRVKVKAFRARNKMRKCWNSLVEKCHASRNDAGH